MKILKSYSFEDRSEMMDFIPEKAEVFLDIGCGEAHFLSKIKDKKKGEFWGVEINKESCNLAKEKINFVLNGKIEEVLSEIPNNHFDCIIFNDCLEHLVDPYSVLENIKVKLKKENSYIVASIPNVRYFYNLKDLVIGKDWEYRDSGILDKTHLRFFTQKSIIRMFGSLNYEIVQLKGINSFSSIKFELLNYFLLKNLEDCRYLQYACVVKLRK